MKYICQIKNGSKNKGNSSYSKYLYLTKKDVKNRKLCVVKSKNIPIWANEDIIFFWKTLDSNERSNARIYKELKFTIPIELPINEREKIVIDICNKLFTDKFTYSYAIYEKYNSYNDSIISFVDLIFSQRINDNISRTSKKYFSRFNNKNPKLGGAKKDVISNSKNWLINTRKEVSNTINFYLEKNNIHYLVSESSYIDSNIKKIPQCYVSRKSYLDYKYNQKINPEIKEYIKIKKQNQKIEELINNKRIIEKKIKKLESNLNRIDTMEFLFDKNHFNYDVLNNIGIHINNEGKLIFKLFLYNHNLNINDQKNSRLIFYKIENNIIIPEFNLDYLKNEAPLGIYIAQHDASNKKDKKIKVTLTSTPIDIFYLSCIDRLQKNEFYQTKNIYIALFDNIINIEEIVPFLVKTKNLNSVKKLYLSFDNKKSIEFCKKLQSNDKINSLFWLEIRANKLGSWKDELSFEMDKINRVCSSNKLIELNSINKNKLFFKLYPKFNKLDENYYALEDDEIIHINKKHNSFVFEDTKLKLTENINLIMKLSHVDYLTAYKMLVNYSL